MEKIEYEKLIPSAINLASRILHIEENVIKYEVVDYGDDAEYRDGIIRFNINYLNDANEYNIVSSTLHEMRHCYQTYQIMYYKEFEKSGLYTEELSVRERWMKEFNSYISPSGDINTDYKFLDQDIEKDAFAFTYYIMKKLFNIELIYPKYLLENIKDKLEKFKKFY